MPEAFRGAQVPRIVAVGVGPDDLIERKGFAAVVPAGEADVVGYWCGDSEEVSVR